MHVKKNPTDPMEKALLEFGDFALAKTEHIHKDWELAQEYPISQNLLAMSNVWRSPDGTEYIIATKGAPESITDLCHFDNQRKRELELQINLMAEQGLRVLGVAKAYFRRSDLPEEQHDFVFNFLGLVGFADPVRLNVADAVKECYNAGIRVVMITGDYPTTAQNIARQIGLKSVDQIITGAELDSMSEDELTKRINKVHIFARAVPEQKLRIVNALKANGEIVAMTGDGVNDAPALKSAHIGIAMGSRGTDVARESSSLVLLDDEFASIVDAVKMGRRIYDNLKKAIAYVFSIHVPIAGMSIAPVLLGWPLILLPVHIVFLELVIDPACSVVFENEREEKNVMKRPPRKAGESHFDRRTIGLALMQGFAVLVALLVIYVSATAKGFGELDARAMVFTTMVIANLALILTNRSWSQTILTTLRIPNRSFWGIVGGVILFLAAVLNLPFLQNLFIFSYLHPFDIAISIFAGFVSVIWFDLIKIWNRR